MDNCTGKDLISWDICCDKLSCRFFNLQYFNSKLWNDLVVYIANLILPHGELRSDEVASDEEAVAEHLENAGQRRQGRLLLIAAQLFLQ